MKSEWIPVTERMPRNGQHVVFCGYDFEEDDTFVHAGYYSEGRHGGWHVDVPNSCLRKIVDSDFVTHWQPLPMVPSFQKMKEVQAERDKMSQLNQEETAAV